MANTIRYIDDENGNHVFPVTHEKAVRDSSNVTLDTKLATFITSSVNNLTNYYLKSETYTKSEVEALISAIKQFSYTVASSLPTASAETMYKFYLVPSADPQAQNVKDEYITVESSGSYSWEQIGSTAVDLSGYVTTTALNTALANYVASETIDSIVELTQSEYDALATKDPGVMYIVTNPDETSEGYVSIADISTQASTEPGGQNVTTITLSNGNTQQIITKNGLNGADGQQGPQGNSGFEAGEGEIELVNNLYQGGETSFLSAEQGRILNEQDLFLKYDLFSIPPTTVTTGKALNASGNSVTNADACLRIFPVVAGDYIYLAASADTAGVYQFQTGSSVPSSGNTSIVGSTVTVAVSRYIRVPETATYLVVSELLINETNRIEQLKEKEQNILFRKIKHNEIDLSLCTDGYVFYTNSSDAVVSNSSSGISSRFRISGGKTYVSCYINVYKAYDNKGKFLYTVSGDSTHIITVTFPQEVYYIRIGYNVSKKSTMQLYEDVGLTFPNDSSYIYYPSDPLSAEAITTAVQDRHTNGTFDASSIIAEQKMWPKQTVGFDEFHWNIVPEDSSFYHLGYNLNSEGGLSYSDVSAATDYIKVNPSYKLYCLGYTIRGYDENKTFISGGVTHLGSGEWSLLDTVVYIRASNYKTTMPFHIKVRGYGQSPAYDSNISYQEYFPIFKSETSAEGFRRYIGVYPFAGKKIVTIGDSFTAPGTWGTRMCSILRATKTANRAVSGGAWSDYSGVPKTAYEQAQELVANNIEADYILCTLGVNDVNNDRPLGQRIATQNIEDFDLTTVIGGMQACIYYLQQNYPDAVIKIGYTPAGWSFVSNKEEKQNALIAAMKDVCLYYGVQYIDVLSCGMSPKNSIYADCYENGTGGGHPTNAGQIRIGNAMARIMMSNM